jgi:hypothetical protein
VSAEELQSVGPSPTGTTAPREVVNFDLKLNTTKLALNRKTFLIDEQAHERALTVKDRDQDRPVKRNVLQYSKKFPTLTCCE